MEVTVSKSSELGCLRRWQRTLDQVKREPGANPGRSRHCDKGVYLQNVTEALSLGRRRYALIFQPGDLPEIGTK